MSKEEGTVVYISMEFGIDQPLKIYSGGLGFLAGSHLRAAFQLKKNLIGIGILYKNGYHDQVRDSEGSMQVQFIKKEYSFLEDTGIIFPVSIHGAEVKVKVFALPSKVFNTAPLYLLSTDIPENDFLSRTITHRLYDYNLAAKIAQYMVLGVGAVKLSEILGLQVQSFHLNEGHGIALLFQLLARYRNADQVREKVCFTTHTPEKAGNDEISTKLLHEMGFFGGLSIDEVTRFAYVENDALNFTVTALKLSKIANGVSKLHGNVSNGLWGDKKGSTPIISITNAQDCDFWMDTELRDFMIDDDDDGIEQRKKYFKKELIEVVADQTGKIFEPDVLTVVWARRFAGYKRADLILRDFNRFVHLVDRQELPLQMIWAGKAYPEDETGNKLFNEILGRTKHLKRVAVLTGYEIGLSRMLKRGADVWLNNPRYLREASGTSGMTAAMNGALNFSIPDGWVHEFAKDGVNCFVIPTRSGGDHEKQDADEHWSLLEILEKRVLPLYYKDKKRWYQMVKNSMSDILPYFDSKRMVKEYYEKMYNL